MIRGELAGRSGAFEFAGGSILGRTGTDFKKPAGTSGREGRPMVAPIQGFCALDWCGALCRSLGGVESQEFVVRDSDSPDGDPYRATGWRTPDRPMPYKRSRACIQALLSTDITVGGVRRAAPWSREEAGAITVHSWKHLFPAVLAIVFPGGGKVLAESGAWAGSEAASMSQAEARSLARGVETARGYAEEGMEAAAPAAKAEAAAQVKAWAEGLMSTPGCRLPVKGSLEAFAAHVAEQRALRRVAIQAPRLPVALAVPAPPQALLVAHAGAGGLLALPPPAAVDV